MIRALAVILTDQTTQLLLLQLHSGGENWCQQFEERNAFAVLSDPPHEFSRMKHKTGCRFQLLTGWAPCLFVLNVAVQNPFQISNDNWTEADLGTPEGKQRNNCLNTSWAVHLGQLVQYLLRQLGKIKVPFGAQSRMIVIPPSFRKPGCYLWRIVPNYLAQALIISPKLAIWSRPIFDILVSSASASGPILCHVLRNGVFIKQAVDERLDSAAFSLWSKLMSTGPQIQGFYKPMVIQSKFFHRTRHQYIIYRYIPGKKQRSRKLSTLLVVSCKESSRLFFNIQGLSIQMNNFRILRFRIFKTRRSAPTRVCYLTLITRVFIAIRGHNLFIRP